METRIPRRTASWGGTMFVLWSALAIEQRFHVIWDVTGRFQSANFAFQHPSYYDWPPSAMFAAVAGAIVTLYFVQTRLHPVLIGLLILSLLLVAGALYNAVSGGFGPLLFESKLYERFLGVRLFGEPFKGSGYLEGTVPEPWQSSQFLRQLAADPGYRVAVLLWVVTAATLWSFVLKKRPPGNSALCIKCGYDLQGNLSAMCPECGTERC